MSLTPTIETERLILRGHRVSDLQPMIEMWNEPAVLRFISDSPWSADQIWARLLRYVGHWQLLDYGYWAVVEKSSGKFIGEMGFAEAMRQMEPSIVGFPELGWALHPQFHGQGFAVEALKSAIQWGDQRLKEKKTVCIISPENLRSIRLAEKCGYREVVRTTCAGKPTILSARERPETSV